MLDSRAVSRERIIGISFVDILIQAVFLLLLILIVGYVDPIEILKLKEYEDIGKDLCVKMNKDSPKSCREFIDITRIGPVADNEFSKVGSDVCKKLGKNSVKDCINALDKVYSLWPCIESKDGVRSPWIARWEINTLPKISHTSSQFFIQATAGSGKTQLALKLLQDAVKAKERCLYVCYNRPLADHLSKLAPAAVEVTTFHQLCRDLAERNGQKIDFADPEVFGKMVSEYVAAAEGFTKSIDLLIIDESQDFETTWALAVFERLKNTGRLYVMGDTGQQLYERETFDLTDAVHVTCMDNFRSPTKVVQVINQLGLTAEPVEARSVHAGETPNIYTWAPGKVSSLTAVEQCLKNLWEDGYTPDQVAVISYHGVKSSEALAQEKLGGYKTKRFSGYDEAGNALWTDGALLVESVYRYKGQSVPVVVLCEVDFEELTDKDKRKLFVGLTRAQFRVDIVLSETSASILLK